MTIKDLQYSAVKEEIFKARWTIRSATAFKSKARAIAFEKYWGNTNNKTIKYSPE